jgi:hypothetical protein
VTDHNGGKEMLLVPETREQGVRSFRKSGAPAAKWLVECFTGFNPRLTSHQNHLWESSGHSAFRFFFLHLNITVTVKAFIGELKQPKMLEDFMHPLVLLFEWSVLADADAHMQTRLLNMQAPIVLVG